MKILRRLGVSETPVALYGPLMPTSRTCGNEESPGTLPDALSPSVRSSGWTKLSAWSLPDLLINEAETSCGPAFTFTGGVRKSWSTLMSGLKSNKPTR